MQTGEDIKLLTQKIEQTSAFAGNLRSELAKTIIGQHHMVDSLLIGLLCNGHVLLEGVPGLAKTLTIKCWQKRCMQNLAAYSLHQTFSRPMLSAP